MRVQGNALRRSRSDRMVAGVCGGLGEFFGISSLWFRIAFLIALDSWWGAGPASLRDHVDRCAKQLGLAL